MSLLSFLFGRPNGSDADGQNPNPSGTMLPGGGPPAGIPGGPPLDAYMTPVPDGAGNIPPNNSAATPPPHGALVNALAQSNPAAPGNQPPAPGPAVTNPVPVDVVGHRPPDTTPMPDNWKPRHESLIGNITDALFGTTIGDRDKRFNEEDALAVLNKNPELAIQRMAQVDPDKAMQLFQAYNSQKRWNALADRESAQTDMQGAQRFSQMMSGAMYRITHDSKTGKEITPTPEAWNSFNDFAGRMAGQMHMNPDMVQGMLSPTYDPNVASMFIGQGDPSYRQANLGQKIDEFSQRLPIMEGNMEANIARAAASGQMARNGAVRNDYYGQDVTNRGNGIQHNIDTHPGPQYPVAITGHNDPSSAQPSGTNAAVPTKNPHIFNRQLPGGYVQELTMVGNKLVPTGRISTPPDNTGKRQVISAQDLVQLHPELFRH